MKIGVIAPAGVVSDIGLQMGIERLTEAGFQVQAHPSCLAVDWVFSGSDEERAQSFLDYAYDPSIDILFCARGGYGSIRTLAEAQSKLESQILPKIPPKKLIVGSSDITVILEFVRKRWKWDTLHATPIGVRNFSLLSDERFRSLVRALSKDDPQFSWDGKKLSLVHSPEPQEKSIRGQLVGGNLSVWLSALGTPFQGKSQDKILFLEEVNESLYRVDRMLQQLRLSQAFEGVQAIVLGEFLNCPDPVAQFLSRRPESLDELKAMPPHLLKPNRQEGDPKKTLWDLFRGLGEKLNLPVYAGLPIGHGVDSDSLPIGGDYEIRADHSFHLLSWDWLRK